MTEGIVPERKFDAAVLREASQVTHNPNLAKIPKKIPTILADG